VCVCIHIYTHIYTRIGDETTRNVPAVLADFESKNVYKVAAGAYHSLSITGCANLASPCSGMYVAVCWGGGGGWYAQVSFVYVWY
jgi:hypothetical protein